MKTLIAKIPFLKNKKEKKATDNSNSGKARKILSKISGAFMLPISVMAIAGFFLGVGAAIATQGSSTNNFALETFGKFISILGDPVFSALPLLFAAAFVIAFTDEAGVAVFAAIIGYFVFNAIQSVFIFDVTTGYSILFTGAGRDPETLEKLVGTTLGTKSLQTSVFGGLTVGLVVQYLYNRFHQIQLPQVISFFGGKRFVAIVTIPSMIVLAFLYLLFWPWVGVALSKFGNALGKVPYGFESFIFGYVERSLVPFGLHHVFYAPLWYSNAGGDLNESLQVWENGKEGLVLGSALLELKKQISLDPNKYVGDSTASNALLKFPFNDVSWSINGKEYSMPLFKFISDELGFKIGRFMDGKFSFMIFGLPGAGLAMILAAPKENRKVALGTVLPSVITCIVTGVTEPIEFTFLFLAPWLFWGVHAFLCAVSFMLANILGVHVPMAFSGGMLDLIIYGVIPFAKGTNFYWTLIVGIPYFFVYFGIFYTLIVKFKIETPGRGSNTKLFTKADYLKKKDSNSSVDPRALAVVLAYGGIDNISAFNNCASRLRYDVVDANKVSDEALKAAGASGVKREGSKHVQAIFGPQAEQLNSLIKAQREKIKEYILQHPELLNDKVENLIEQETQPANKASDGKVVELSAPALGKVKTLATLNDGVFSEKMSGEGFVVEFAAEHNASIFSPVDGTITLVFPTKHAYGITTEDGINVLLHIGIDTVNLNGKGFEACVEQGQKVKKGDLVAKVNLDVVRDAKLKSDLVTVILPDSSKTSVKIQKLNTNVSSKETTIALVK
ncbi:PTS transporter subunit IIABC [Mycoplasmopsis pullorum]|uniref:PTS sugar transporter subunit IIABC n=1 Tax=Mycoplasmopsis pullorum TaxID=48003 RepID=A0A1L4FRQ7_9BACT|nr:PTS transporter subunit IIABC [Mycoplasmopsis pullorum]APJ38274.1 PTS sugar transporter subunit IIABC [Mycoplasmopsis pullorum]